MTNYTPQVTCIGLANVDVIANVESDFITAQNIALGGSTILDSCQTGNLLSKLEAPEFFPGGGAANTACGLALQGVKTRFIGKTGDDIYADIFRRGFNDYNVQFDTPAHAMKMTSTCLTLITPDKNRSFGICLDTAGWFIDEDDLPTLAQDGSQSVYLEANAARPVPGIFNGTLLQKAVAKYAGRNINLYISLNDWEIIASCRDQLRAMLNHEVSFFLGNVFELQTLFETGSTEQTLHAAAATGKNFAITDGSNGVYIVRNGQTAHMPAAALHASRVINTLGAGDQFAAGFVAGQVSGMNVMDSALNGIRSATDILQKRDARPDAALFRRTRPQPQDKTGSAVA